MAAAFHGDPDRVYLARGAACGVGFPFSQVPENTFYTVATYVSKEHWLAMQAEILKEKKANNIVRVLMHWKVQGICAAGTVEKDGRVVYGLSPCTWCAHAPLSQRRGKFLHLSHKVVHHLKGICAVMQLYTGQRVWLGQLKAKWEWFSIDASTGVGMEAVLDKR
ncbi:hypothetical protein CYMTET_39461 [Cymbomonas tetramitiformis]|uniref:Uncharacterized protein n=1 Tax=Cymbomonas tetramitiformis TaxID=36881 RepID=A0AAE0CA07_9CHLO|nr:hypothetical protein CYMTET_39461 [Cymbomonas tetramitiformis]